MVLILFLPLAGLKAAGRDIGPYLEFPPKPGILAHAPFSSAVFFLILGAVLVFVLPLVCQGMKTPAAPEARQPRRPLPWWGWAGILCLLVFWFLAWTRQTWFAPFQPHTFFPLWMSVILVINAVIFMRSGTSPLTASPGRFCTLFPVSALFWWTFEYLNRFVGNWVYSGSDYGPVTYFVLATLSFSTVLPAIESMKALVMTFDRIAVNFRRRTPLPFLNTRSAGLGFMALGSASLFLIPRWPDPLFFTVWTAPLLLFWGWAAVSGRPHPLTPITRGDFTPVAAYALAAFLCGCLWEMFNLYSLARWTYTIPYADVLHIFEMPLLGYAGYLPFGLEAAMVIHLIYADNPSDGIAL